MALTGNISANRALSKRLFIISQNDHVNDEFSQSSELLLEEEISSLIEDGADPNFRFQGSNPLCEACRKGFIEAAKLLVNYGAKLDTVDKYKCSPLYLAASHGHLQLCQFLLDCGADINSENKFRYTPLLSALENQHIDVTRFLIRRGANVNLRHPTGAGSLQPKSLFDYVLFRSQQDTFRELSKMLILAGVRSQSFNVKSTFVIINTQQVPKELLKVMMHCGFKFHPKCLDWQQNMENVSEEETDFVEFLREELSNVSSLQKITRTTIRNHLTFCAPDIHMQRKIDQLLLPVTLKNFLQLHDLSYFLDIDQIHAHT